MYADRIEQVHQAGTIDHYCHHRRPHCLQRRQWSYTYQQLRPHCLQRRKWSYTYQQLRGDLPSVPSELVKLEIILNSISYPSPNRTITYSAQNRTIRYSAQNRTIPYLSSNRTITHVSSNRPITYSDPNRTITYKAPKGAIISPRINITVLIKKIFVAFFLIIVTLASGNDIMFKDNPVTLRPSTARNSASQSPASHYLYSTLYHPSPVTTSTDSSSLRSSVVSSKVSIQESLSLLSQHSFAQMDVPDTRAHILSQLISNLEKLQILNKTDETCFRLDKITLINNEYSSSAFSSTLPSPAPDQSTVGVFLYFRELSIPTSGLASSLEQSKPSKQHSMSSNQHSPSSNHHLMRSNQRPQSSLKADSMSLNNNDNTEITDNRCVSEPVIEVHRLAGNNNMQEGRGQSVSHRHTNSHTQRTHQFNGVQPPKGLSRTQIVVISTCSGIIGMFFLIAAFLRLRNYIKRSRMEQELARRPKFRSCSVALRGATQSLEQLRRDSVSSKASHQNSLLTQANDNNMSGLQREISANSLRYQLDQAPLLINSKSLKALDASTLADSHSSLKYIDEISLTPKKKDIALSMLAKNNNNNLKKYVPKQSCLLHQAEISVDASTLVAAQTGAIIYNANIPKAWKKSARFSGGKRGEHLNPVSSTGSFKGRVLEGTVSPGVHQIDMLPRLRWVRVAGDDRSPETILTMFTKSGSTGQIGTHNTSNSILDVESTGQIGTHNTSNSILDVESTGQIGTHNTPSSNCRLVTGSGPNVEDSQVGLVMGLNVEGSQVGLVIGPTSGTQSKDPIDRDAAGPPRAVFGFNSGKPAGGDVHNLDKELEIKEHGRQDEKHGRKDEELGRQDEETQGRLADKLTTNLETSSPFAAIIASEKSVARSTQHNLDVHCGTENSDPRNFLQVLVSTNVGVSNDSSRETSINTSYDKATVNAESNIQDYSGDIHENGKLISQNEDILVHPIDREPSVKYSCLRNSKESL